MSEPPIMLYKNNKSTSHRSFIESPISELLSWRCIVNVPFQSYIVSPLSVAENSSWNLRLILALSNLNFYVRKERWNTKTGELSLSIFKKIHTCTNSIWNQVTPHQHLPIAHDISWFLLEFKILLLLYCVAIRFELSSLYFCKTP